MLIGDGDLDRRGLTSRRGPVAAQDEISQYTRSPDSRYEQFGPGDVRCVFVAERLEHHPFLRADTKGEENSERHKVRWSDNPIRNHERLPDGVKEQCGVHWMTDMTIDSFG